MRVHDPVFAAERSVQFATLRRRIDEGIRCLERRDASGAIEAFATAYAIAAAWDFGSDVTYGALLNLALAYSLAGDHRSALDAYQRAMALPELGDARRAVLLNHMGKVCGHQGDARRAAWHFARAYRLARRVQDAPLRAQAAANAAVAYRHVPGPRSAARGYRWAERAVEQAAAADAGTRQFAAVQLCAAALAAGHADEAGELLERIRREGVEPDLRSEFCRLLAEWELRRGDRRAALAHAARAADHAVWDRNPEDLQDAWSLLRRLAGRRLGLVPLTALSESLRVHQDWIAAFFEAAGAGLEGAADDAALLLAGPDGLVLARHGADGLLERWTRRGVVVGTRLAVPGPDPRLRGASWQPLDVTGPAPFVAALPGVPALARVVAGLTAHLYRDRAAESRRAEEELTLAKLSAFHDVALALGRPLETDELVAELLAVTRRAVGSSAAALVMVEREGLWADGLRPEQVQDAPVVRKVAETGRAVLLDAGHGAARQALAALGVASLLAVPVYFGTAACGAVLLAARDEPRPFSERELELLTFLSKQFGLALENAALRDDLRRRLETLTQDLLVARRLQVALMPPGPVRSGPLTIAGLSLPAKHVGGDVFDYTHLPDGSWVVFLGDVMGKGVAAAILGSILHTRVRQLLAEEPFGPGLVARLAAAMWDDLNRGQALATMVLVRVDPERRRLAVATAGHPGPLHWRQRRWQVLGRGGGTALGLRSSGGQVGYGEYPLGSSELLLLYSDGLGELLLGRRGLARGEEVAQHLGQMDIVPGGAGPESLLARIRRLARRRDLTDDVTVVAVQWGPWGEG